MTIIKFSNYCQTILLTVKWQNKDNIITINWHSPLSHNPAMYGVVINKNRYSLEFIKNSKVFVVNFMSKDFKDQALYCGQNSGRNVDKFEKTGLKKENSETINCPRIKQANGWLECQVKKEIELGDSVLFLAEIKKANLKNLKCVELLAI